MSRAAWLLALLLSPLPAQQQDPAPELGRLQRQLQQNRNEVERLLDLRIRHDLGLPLGDAGNVFAAPAAVSSQAAAAAQQQLAEAEATTASLLQRKQELQARLAQLRSDADAAVAQHRDDPEWVTLPRPGQPMAAPPQQAAPASVSPVDPGPGAAVAAGNAGGAAAPPPAMMVLPNLGPVRGQIHGTDDHGLVAQALFRAAEALVERGEQLRRQGSAAAADQCDAEAEDRLQRALTSLQQALVGDAPPLGLLFHQGKCRELLFRLAERHHGLDLAADAKEYQRREQEVREPFVSITARDVQAENGVLVPGPWGRAAQTALDHFRWINLNGGFRPRIPLESITWQPKPPQ